MRTRPGVRPVSMSCCGIAVWLFFLTAAATPLLAEPKPIAEEQSPFYLALDIPQAFADHGWDAEYSKRVHTISSIARSGIDPRAEIVLVRLAPDYFLQWITDAEGLLARFPFFTNAKANDGSQSKVTIGDFHSTYVTAVARHRECVVFSGSQGQGGGDFSTSEGTRYIAGYYCQPVSDALEDTAIKTVIGAIGLKPEGAASPAKFPAPIPE